VLRQNQKDNVPVTVAILGGNPVVGRTLEVILSGSGYDARFLNGSFIEKPAELPEEVGLVILSPGLHPKGRERFLKGRENGPVLELISAPKEGRADQPGYVPWPCPVKDLELEIEAVLLAGVRAGQQDATTCIVDIEPTKGREVSIHFVACKARTAPLLEDDRRLLPSIDSTITKTAVGTRISRVKTLLGDADSAGDDIAFAPMAGAAWVSQQAYGR
jgi:hypothetical protein